MRGMALRLEGGRIAHVEQRREDLRAPFPENLPARLEGRLFTKFARRSKYILACLDDGNVLVLHLGMAGRMVLLPPEACYTAAAHDHLVLTMADGTRAVFTDPRRFGMVLLLPESGWQQHKAFKDLGPEPLEDDFDGRALAAALKGRKASIKDALMNQKIVAGLGNIYVSEALFVAGISPRRKAYTVTGARAARLAQAIRDVLAKAIAAGGSSLRDYRDASGELGYFQHHFAVYGREGEACPACLCEIHKTGGIRKIVQAGRSTYYCPQHQR